MYTLRLDSTQIVSVLTCKRFWQLQNIEHLNPIGGEERNAILIGSYGHYWLENYYKAKARGQKIPTSMEIATAGAAEQAQALALPISKEDVTRINDRCAVYAMTYTKIHDFEVNSPDNVEVGFSETIYKDEYYHFILEGKIDIYKARIGINEITVDHKFQMARRQLYLRSIQFRNYAMVAEAPLFMINYIRMAQNIDKFTFQREVVSFSRQELRLWREELIKIFFELSDSIHDNKLNKNRAACAGKWGECMYTPICDEINENTAENKKSILYQVKKEWLPWEHTAGGI